MIIEIGFKSETSFHGKMMFGKAIHCSSCLKSVRNVSSKVVVLLISIIQVNIKDSKLV